MNEWLRNLFGRRAESSSGLTREDLDRAIALYLARERRRLSSGAYSGARTSAEKLALKRFARRKVQEERKRLRRGKRRLPPLPKYILAARYRPSPVLESFFPERSKVWKPIIRRPAQTHHKVLEINQFSFLHDPVSTLRAIGDLVKLEATELRASVNFKIDYVQDLGAFLLLSEMWPSFAPVFTGGMMSDPVMKVLEAVGLRSALRMEFPPIDDSDVWAMPVQRRRPRGRSDSLSRHLEPQSREAVSDMICREIDKWLLRAKTECELTDDARSNFAVIIGEILDNAERHSSVKDRDGTWTVAAFMARREIEGEEVYACHMAFLSLGDTFAEGLESTSSPRIREVLGHYVDEQKRNAAPQSRETLITLAAIQDGITCDPRAFEDGRGGTGLLDIADMVYALAASDAARASARVTIISGRSCIMLNGPYIRGVSEDDDDPRKLWCNATNSRKEAPSSDHVFDLPIKLPGTVISVSFKLDTDYLRSIHDAPPN